MQTRSTCFSTLGNRASACIFEGLWPLVGCDNNFQRCDDFPKKDSRDIFHGDLFYEADDDDDDDDDDQQSTSSCAETTTILP